MEKFLVLAQARSGTHFFETVLSSHPDIHSFIEIMPDLRPESYHCYWLGRIAEDEKNILPHNQTEIFDDYLSYIFSSMPGKKALGIDIKYQQLEWIPYRGIYSVLKKHHVKVIHLIRLNLLKLYLSNVFNSYKEKLNRGTHTTEKVPSATATINPTDMISYFRVIKANIDEKRNIFSKDMDYLEVYYENCFDSPDFSSDSITPYVLDQVYDFLRIEDKRYDLRTNLIKMNPSRIQDMISNYGEVADALLNTEWEYLLDDMLGMVR